MDAPLFFAIKQIRISNKSIPQFSKAAFILFNFVFLLFLFSKYNNIALYLFVFVLETKLDLSAGILCDFQRIHKLINVYLMFSAKKNQHCKRSQVYPNTTHSTQVSLMKTKHPQHKMSEANGLKRPKWAHFWYYQFAEHLKKRTPVIWFLKTENLFPTLISKVLKSSKGLSKLIQLAFF